MGFYRPKAIHETSPLLGLHQRGHTLPSPAGCWPPPCHQRSVTHLDLASATCLDDVRWVFRVEGVLQAMDPSLFGGTRDAKEYGTLSISGKAGILFFKV